MARTNLRTYNRGALRDGPQHNHTDRDKANATVAEIRGVLYTACAQQLLLYTFTSFFRKMYTFTSGTAQQ
jgi:hypothetical protein